MEEELKKKKSVKEFSCANEKAMEKKCEKQCMSCAVEDIRKVAQ